MRAGRKAASPFWKRLRLLIRERGHEPTAVALADLFPDDDDTELGVLVTPEGSVFEFDLVRVEGDRHHPTESFVRDWNDRTDWQARPTRHQAELALRLLDAERA